MTQSNLVTLTGAILSEANVFPEIIQLLEEALDKAKAGEISSIAMVTLTPGSWAHLSTIARSGQSMALLGGISLLERDYQNEWKQNQ